HASARAALPPQQDGWAAHPHLTGDGSIRPTGRREQDDPGPLHELRRRAAHADEEFEARARGGIEREDSCWLARTWENATASLPPGRAGSRYRAVQARDRRTGRHRARRRAPRPANPAQFTRNE